MGYKPKILLTGGSGKLGQEIQKYYPNIIAPSQDEMDVANLNQVYKGVWSADPDIVIHAAALVGTKECEENKNLAWKTNVIGTRNVAQVCHALGVRLIFISSAAIFDGEKGNYKEDDIPNPLFFYAVTKVIGEQIVLSLNYDSVVIRLDFFPLTEFKYKKVFIDHYTSKIPVTGAAQKILKVARSRFKGIINIGDSRDSLYNIIKPYCPTIKPIKIKDSSLPDFPKDISLNLEKWKEIIES